MTKWKTKGTRRYEQTARSCFPWTWNVPKGSGIGSLNESPKWRPMDWTSLAPLELKSFIAHGTVPRDPERKGLSPVFQLMCIKLD